MTSISIQGFVCLLILCGATAARGELVLGDFDASTPIKVMAIGDSITDDCSLNGAWRAPLQRLLETNGFPFTFVGRQISITNVTFTKARHEGYCGAVVAPPGVFPAHQYSDVNNYLQKIVPDALAVASNRPDVMLILIGANDIGRGRNPYQVATNDMDTLLAMIFSNAPSANVILAKASSIQGNTSLNYGMYAQNVPIYNAMLQKVVNQHRALGENVFLADMFSAVDPATMPDHVHPNSVGLQLAAREWLTRMQTITIRTDLVTTVLINGGADWKYNDTGTDPGTNWAQADYDDSGWSNGIARLGYGDPATATTVSYGPQSLNKFVTTYFRRPFVVPSDTVITNLNLRVARADGVIVWFNGQEIYRANLPAGPITYTNLASGAMTVFTRPVFYPTNVPVTLPAGTNWIAAEVHLSSVTAAAMGFDMELIGAGYRIPPPTLSISRVGENNVALNWPLSNGGGFSLYSTTNLITENGWTPATALIQTNGDQAAITQAIDADAKFFRLQKP